jgi:nucleobase:cation symporter-1, NCS1 family
MSTTTTTTTTTATTAIDSQPSAFVQQIEGRSIDWIPLAERKGSVRSQAMLWFLGNFQFLTIVTGFLGVTLGLSMWWSIVAGSTGILFGTLFMAFHATQGPVFGLPQMIQSRAQFGFRGVIVALFGTFFTFMAFNVVDQILLSEGLHATFGLNKEVVAIGVTAIGCSLAIFGHDWLHKAFQILLVVSVPLFAIITVAALFGKAGGAVPANPGGFTLAAFAAQFSVAAAYNISYAPYVSDYSRYLPKETRARPIIAAVFFGASGSAIWLIGLGAWLASRFGAADGLLGLQTAGNNIGLRLGSITAALSAASLVAVMGMNAYGAMLTVVTAVDSVKPIKPARSWRVVALVVLAVVWYLVAKAISTDSLTAVFNALTLMLYLLVPWTAINLVDFFFVRRGHYAITELFRPQNVYGSWSRSGLIAYAIGFCSQIPFMVIYPIGSLTYTGWGAKHLLASVDLAWLVGLIVSGIAFYALTRSIDREAETAAIVKSEQELAQLV